MTLDEFKRGQKRSVREFRKLRKDDPAAAKRVAKENLRAAGIITSSGNLAPRYR